MIDADAVHDVLSGELADQFVAALEDFRVFRVDRDELVDPEESPVVDLVVGRAPVRQPVMLLLEQLMQQVRVAVDMRDRLVQSVRRQRARPTSMARAEGAREPQRI